ncbi:MAG: AmmeMemoRadiSam system protein A [Clostridiales Family XIII bacterium]|jgi:AmmeMemoRadiSam system protein A|nr:AmmeMemoRadiSam system protein A [Clostridiales Family XIII bacterium]
MGIVAGFVVPHPPLIFPEVGRGKQRGIQATIDAYQKVSEEICALAPDTVVVVSPHTELYADYFHISPGGSAAGDMTQFGVSAQKLSVTVSYDEAYVSALSSLCESRGFPAGTLGGRDASLDHATMIPARFLLDAGYAGAFVRAGVSGFPLADHYRFGMLIREAAEALGRRVVVVASADLSHKLLDEGPYGYAPEGPLFDAAVCEAIEGADFLRLLELDPGFCEKAGECGHRPMLVMAGALDGDALSARLLSYEGPFGVGYGVGAFLVGVDEGTGADAEGGAQAFAANPACPCSSREFLGARSPANSKLALRAQTVEFADGSLAEKLDAPRNASEVGGESLCAAFGVRAGGEGARVLEVFLSKEKVRAMERREAESVFVRLARETVESFVSTRRLPPLPGDLPGELTGRRAGVFVSIKEHGELRGCIGTISPVTCSIAEEIRQNAVSASTRDPRFEAIAEEELPFLTISVDVLGEAEAIGSMDQLDPKRYGVIVSLGGKRGLLLPDLDGIDTAEEQVAIAMRKAGIAEKDAGRVRLERFEVVRYT